MINVRQRKRELRARYKKLRAECDPAAWEEQISMMEMVLDVDDIIDEMSSIRDEYCKYL